MLQKGIENISSAGCGMRKTDQDVINCSVIESIVSTRDRSSLVKIYVSRIFWDQFLCDVVARKKQITTNAGTYISSSVKAYILIKLNFILCKTGKCMQHCELIVTLG